MITVGRRPRNASQAEDALPPHFATPVSQRPHGPLAREINAALLG